MRKLKALLLLRDAFYEANPKFIKDVEKLGIEVKALYHTDNGIEKSELLSYVKDVDIIIVTVVKIDREVIDQATNLQYIMKYGAGYDNIDVAYAREKGIPVTNAPGQNAPSAADLAFGLMLAAAREIPVKDTQIKAKHWELSVGFEVQKKTLGVIGFGAIGKTLAKRASGFDMDVVAFGNHKDEEAAKSLNVTFVELKELLAVSDFVVICTTVNDHNREMINKETLGLMKPTGFLINVSRGGLVKEIDLIDALKTSQIKGAALDVFAEEPPTNGLPYLPNLIATPHIGGATFEAIERTGNVTIENLQRFLAGEQLEYLISN
ncbi:phosphoglycerate dehydrogenase [Paraliobacillus zengyii]|uniref:phosphoglycerate dehydrogenase n=1 Tax=Paraliobacillus zengyii TaxID=2213194 RepID=UPI000DD46F0F|nr:phosphoglycerate dehydrogenase [Paraliobacillus zengyii]